MRWRRWVAGAAAVLLALAYRPTVVAGDWITKGGTPHRTSTILDPRGLIELTPYWETNSLGESAAQPVVIDGIIYHVAGAYLWQLELDELHRPIGVPTAIPDPIKEHEVEFNRAPDGPVIPRSPAPATVRRPA